MVCVRAACAQRECMPLSLLTTQRPDTQPTYVPPGYISALQRPPRRRVICLQASRWRKSMEGWIEGPRCKLLSRLLELDQLVAACVTSVREDRHRLIGQNARKKQASLCYVWVCTCVSHFVSACVCVCTSLCKDTTPSTSGVGPLCAVSSRLYYVACVMHACVSSDTRPSNSPPVA